MKKNILLLLVMMLLTTITHAQLIQGTIKKGAGNSIEVWLKPNFSNTTQYLYQIGLPIAVPSSSTATSLNVTLDAGFTTAFGNNYTVTVNPVANNTGATEKYFNVVLVRGGSGSSDPQTWTSGTEFRVLTATFGPAGAPASVVKLADYQDGGSDGQGNFYSVDGNANYYVTNNSVNNFYATAGHSSVGGTASAGYAVTTLPIPCDVPTVPAITGTTTVTVGSTTQLANTTAGGTWSSDAAGTASVNATGLVTGVAAGTTTIRYSVTNSCGTTEVNTSITVEQKLLRATIKKGTAANEVEIWLKPNFSNSTQYLYQVGLPIAFPTSATPAPTTLTPVLDAGFITAFGNNYTVTVNPIANNTGNTEKYFNVVLVRGGSGSSDPQTWTAGTEFKVLSATFHSTASTPPTAQVKIADYQNGGSDGQGNFYSVDGIANYYVTTNSVDNFYASAGQSTTGGTATAGYAQTISAVTLPVSILNISGYRQAKNNIVEWTTATEINNKGFEVQRSADGVNYSKVGFVNSKAENGNSTTQLNYRFTDNNASYNKLYYRLRQVDNNGAAKLSNIVIIKGDNPTKLEIAGVFPNPTKDNINIVIDAPKQENITIVLTDLSGKVIKQQSVGVTQGSNTMMIETSMLASGTYYIKVVCASGCETATSRFIKQ